MFLLAEILHGLCFCSRERIEAHHPCGFSSTIRVAWPVPYALGAKVEQKLEQVETNSVLNQLTAQNDWNNSSTF